MAPVFLPGSTATSSIARFRVWCLLSRCLSSGASIAFAVLRVSAAAGSTRSGAGGRSQYRSASPRRRPGSAMVSGTRQR